MKTSLMLGWKQASLLRRLHAQTLPDATPPIGIINHFSKTTVTFEPLMGFDVVLDLKILDPFKIVYFITNGAWWRHKAVGGKGLPT